MLRTTMESMSAILGGADIIFNSAYDSTYNEANDFGQRIARNQLLLLREESYFGEIENPTNGSYYIETLTQKLAEKALTRFKDLEASGGLLTAIKTGQIQSEINSNAELVQEQFNRGEMVLIGTNKYGNNAEQPPVFNFSKIKNQKEQYLAITPLKIKRLGAELEYQKLNNG